MYVWDTNHSYGTCEFWVLITDASKHFDSAILSSGTSVCNVRAFQDEWTYQDNSGWHTITGLPLSDNIWYHVRMDWEASNGGYLGLEQWKWRFSVNEVFYGPYTFVDNLIPARHHYYLWWNQGGR